jgi:hypothetical protein
MRRLAVILAAVAFAAACGKDNGSPAAPTAPQITAITVAGPDLVNLGRTASYSAAMTGGTAACSWGDDAPQVGTISANGALTGVGNGKVTIWCDAAGVRGTKLVQVLASYAGSWIGSYRVTGCTETGDLQGLWCDGFSVDRVLPLSGSFTQTGATASGSLYLGQITAAPVTASLADDGTLHLAETHDGTGLIGIRSEWELHQTQDGKITGHVTIVISETGLVGTATVQGEIFNTNRTTALSTSTLAPRAPLALRTIDDALRALRQ